MYQEAETLAAPVVRGRRLLTFKKKHRIRWARSSYLQTQACYRNWTPYVRAYSKIASSPDFAKKYRDKADGARRRIVSPRFVLRLAVIKDYTTANSLASTALQSSDLTHEDVVTVITILKEGLTTILNGGGDEERKAVESLRENGTFQDERVTGDVEREIAFARRFRRKMARKSLDNLTVRFGKWRASYYRPCIFLLRNWGDGEDVSDLRVRFTCSSLGFRSHISDRVVREWRAVKESILEHLSSSSLNVQEEVMEALRKQIANGSADAHLVRVVQSEALSVVSSVPCESCFSVASQVKKKGRWQLSNSILDLEVFMRCNAPQLGSKEMDTLFDRAATLWLKMRRRRLSQKKSPSVGNVKTSLLEAFRRIDEEASGNEVPDTFDAFDASDSESSSEASSRESTPEECSESELSEEDMVPDPIPSPGTSTDAVAAADQPAAPLTATVAHPTPAPAPAPSPSPSATRASTDGGAGAEPAAPAPAPSPPPPPTAPVQAPLTGKRSQPDIRSFMQQKRTRQG